MHGFDDALSLSYLLATYAVNCRSFSLAHRVAGPTGEILPPGAVDNIRSPILGHHLVLLSIYMTRTAVEQVQHTA